MFKKNKNRASAKGRFPEDLTGIINYTLVQDEEENTGKCDGSLIKFNFLDENMSICVTSKEEEVDALDKDALRDVAIIVGYLIESEIEKAYYQVDNDTIYTFDGYGSNYSFSQVKLDGIPAIEMAETFFEGEAHTLIPETINKIKETYTKKKYTKEIILTLLSIAILYYGVNFFQESDIVNRVNKVPRPTSTVLTNKEKLLLERDISIQLLKEVSTIKKEYKSDRFIFAKKRISVFSMNGFRDLPKDEASTGDEVHWGWMKGTNRRGGKQASLKIVKQQFFPEVGYELASKDLFQKTDAVKLSSVGSYVDQNFMKLSKLSLTEECLVSVLKLATDETKPKKRSIQYTEIELVKMTPSELSMELMPLILKCPIVINRLNLSPQGKFNLSVSVFKVNNDNKIEAGRLKNEKK